ncbi:hypothetical protein Pmani_008005 [Petrolisthes manimaculis]|uniref:Uncharacterized protein n=1 Tax=Petrolisthes manimaculis TaxID=1843537 RepID=A0AAE1Q9R7_9EUCA|nr:hypothetical protein Pmani_008005 [Petrolisthes manimaculis]
MRPSDGSWGIKKPNGEWTGMMGMVHRNAMPKPKKPEQEVVPNSPTTSPGTPRIQAQAVGESHDVILQMLQLFKVECEQKRQEARSG